MMDSRIERALMAFHADLQVKAAAPEMLQALKMLLESHDRTCNGEGCQLSGIDLARAAVAKAEGR
jgi:hypothetical protein